MDEYVKEDDRDLVVLFLTDGFPNYEIDNHKPTFELLKSKYPYMEVYGIQYEMGNDIREELTEISDMQWVANMETLNNILFETSTILEKYKKYEVIDYIDNDYFILNSEDDIDVTNGIVRVEEENGIQKIIWTLDNIYMMGTKQQMKIKLSLKDEYKDKTGYYTTNKKENVKYKTDDDEIIINSKKTPVLKKELFKVTYDSNTPSGCNIPNKIKKYYGKDRVILEEPLSCDGYLFKGWTIITDVKKVNDDVFIMPDSDVIIRGVWSKHGINKSMSGTIYSAKSRTLYNVIEKLYNERDSMDTPYVDKYTGKVVDTYDEQGDKDIYYYYSDGSDIPNTLMFGNKCWRIVRTTKTGGVKLVYIGRYYLGYCTPNNLSVNFNSKHNSISDVGYMYNKRIEL